MWIQRIMMHKIKITQAMRDEAKQLTDRKVPITYGCSPTGFEMPSRYVAEYTGFLGQIIYRNCLKLHHKQFIEINEINGKGDYGKDFILIDSTKAIVVDVKSSQMSQKYKNTKWDKLWFFLINIRQAVSPRTDYFASVQISLNQRIGYVMGHIKPSEVQKYGILKQNTFSFNYNVMFKCLYDII